VRAALVYGSEILTGARDPRMVDLLRDALVAAGPAASSTRARVMARLAAALVPAPHDDREPGLLANEALAMVRRTGDAHATLAVLQSYAGSVAFRIGARERQAIVREILGLASSLDKPAVMAASLPWAMADDLELSGLVACDARIGEVARLIERVPQPHYRVRLPVARMMRASILGPTRRSSRSYRTAR